MTTLGQDGVGNLQLERSPHELAAKAALLDFIIQSEGIGASSAVISELELRSSGRRADLVITHPRLEAYEIKTHADTLIRLPSQLDTFSRAFPFVHAVVAKRHLQKTRAIAPAWCGIIELSERSGGLRARRVRKAKLSPALDVATQASALPVRDLRKALKEAGGAPKHSQKRNEMLADCNSVAVHRFSEVIQEFLREKYSATSIKFLESVLGRGVEMRHLGHLRAWQSKSITAPARDPDLEFFNWLQGQAGRDVLGKVPSDIAELFNARVAA